MAQAQRERPDRDMGRSLEANSLRWFFLAAVFPRVSSSNLFLAASPRPDSCWRGLCRREKGKCKWKWESGSDQSAPLCSALLCVSVFALLYLAAECMRLPFLGAQATLLPACLYNPFKGNWTCLCHLSSKGGIRPEPSRAERNRPKPKSAS